MKPSSQRASAKAFGRAGALVAAIGAAAALGGCDPDDFDRSLSEGELAKGDFKYACVSPADVACEYRCTFFTCEASATNEQASLFPENIAVGALFALSYEYDGTASGGSRYRVQPASPAWVDEAGAGAGGESKTFVARRAGQLAFLARDQGGRVIDLLHVAFVPLHHLEVNDFGAAAVSVPLEPGDSYSLQVYPQGVDGRQLGGALTYAWTSSDEAVALVAQGSASDRVKIEAKAPGTATVRVAVGEVTREVSFQVGAP
ncbi:MAG TPA: Ig-like domain-containing protein [Polyangiaceae bacterium]|nr:Ig-like domain-containing protein [Polyangiaceae bacterium]